MFDYLKKCFGEGVVRMEGKTEDGKKFEVKAPFAGDIASEEELINEMVNDMLVEKGIRVKRIRIMGIKGAVSNQNLKLTGNWYTVG